MLGKHIQALLLLAGLAAAAPAPISENSSNALVKRAGEGIHLVNCTNKAGGQSSQMMYWRDDSRANGSNRPDDQVTVSNNGWQTWEGRSVSGRFGTGVTFTSNIQANGSGLPPGSRAGTGYNGSNWVCFRDNGRGVYNDGGIGCSGVYYCLKGRGLLGFGWRDFDNLPRDGIAQK